MVQASWRAAATRVSSRALRARPKTKSTRFCSHQSMSASRAKAESARSTIVTRGQRARTWCTMRWTASTAPGTRIDVGAAQLGGQEMTAAKDVERQVAVAIIVAMEK